MRLDKFEIITNNPLVCKTISRINHTQEDTLYDVLTVARDRIHLGAKIISHPLAGSVKPHETPYRSIILSHSNDELDFQSLNTLEQAIERYQVLCKNIPDHLTQTSENIVERYEEKKRNDFQLIDCQLIKSSLSSFGLHLD